MRFGSNLKNGKIKKKLFKAVISRFTKAMVGNGYGGERGIKDSVRSSSRHCICNCLQE